MLDIFILASTSLPPHPPISPSINQVESYQVRLIDHNKNMAASECPQNVSTSMNIQPKMISIAMSNIDRFTPNHLLQQMYGTQVLDEDVDLGLSDEELESVVGQGGDANSHCSDIFYQGKLIVDYQSFLAFMDREPDGWKQIDYICNQFARRGLLDCNPQSHDRNVVAAEIWQQIRDRTAVFVKRAHNGFTIDLRTAKLTYRR